MKKELMFAFLLCFVILSSGFVFAGDVAYVYRSENKVDSGFVNAFDEMNLDVDLINEKNLGGVDFSDYRLVFVGDEQFKYFDEFFPLGDSSVVLVNSYYTKDFGFLEKGRTGNMVSTFPIMIKKQNSILQVYSKARFSIGGAGIPVHYLSEKFLNPNAEVLSYMNSGKIFRPVVVILDDKKCFFGATETKYWTNDIKDLFEDCVNKVIGEVEEPECGNDILEEGEQCDDGNMEYDDGCSASCLIEVPEGVVCGNGILEISEQCDDSNLVNGDGCSSLCVIEIPEPVCGNNILENGEQCDDGNLVNSDGCSSVCVIETPQVVCGNGILETGEECDDNNLVNGDGCSSICIIEVPQGPTHDVGLSDYKITDLEGNLIGGAIPQLMKDTQYKILIDLTNLGNFVENNVTFEGEIKDSEGVVVKTFTHTKVDPLEIGEVKNDKTRTVLFDMGPGVYSVNVKALIVVDDVLGNNLVGMNVEVV